MRKTFKKLHLWLSVPFGLVIAIICFSGAMLVFEQEITEAAQRDMVYVEKVGEKPLPVSEIASKVAATLPDSIKVTGVVISTDPERSYKVNISKPKKAFIYVDQYTGEIKGKNERLGFFKVMFRLHRWLMDSKPEDGGIYWGKMIVGVSTLVFVVILITGLVIWIPKSRKALKNRLAVCATKGWKRLWYDLHVAGGFYALLLLLAMALTGLTWSFSWYRTGFYKAFGIETTAKPASHAEAKSESDKRGKGRRGERKEKSDPFASWTVALDNVKKTESNYSRITVSDGRVSVSRDTFGNQRASDTYRFDKRSGEITEVQPYADVDAATKMRGWIYSVHVGNWGGMLTRILTFLAAMLGASLPLTGYYLWIRRLYRKRTKQCPQ